LNGAHSFTSKKSHAHLQCVHNNCAGLKNVSLKVWEELITQSENLIKRRPSPSIHHSISPMHFVQLRQKLLNTSNVSLCIFWSMTCTLKSKSILSKPIFPHSY
jgi:hypothetical protein